MTTNTKMSNDSDSSRRRQHGGRLRGSTLEKVFVFCMLMFAAVNFLETDRIKALYPSLLQRKGLPGRSLRSDGDNMPYVVHNRVDNARKALQVPRAASAKERTATEEVKEEVIANPQSTKRVRGEISKALTGPKPASTADDNEDSVQKATPNNNNKKPLPTKPVPLESTPKCATWQEDLDDWWQAHPDWDVASENATHYCFAPIADPVRAEMLRTVHQRQFPEDPKLCAGKKNVNIKTQEQLGFAGVVYVRLQKGFWQAHQENKLFLPGLPYEDFRWMFTPQQESQCPSKTRDHECYFLPVTNCPRPVGAKETQWRKFYDWELFGSGHKFPVNKTLQEHALWLGNYLARPRHHVRQALYKFMHEEGNGVPKQLPTQCTWIHVRRGDAMTEKGYDRNFYSIQNYITLGKIKKDEPILLLTDDETAIEEATLLHPEYDWVYFDRKRNRGPVAYNSHIPENSDPFHEVMVLLAEQKFAAQCHKGVFGKSNMLKLFEAGMIKHHHLEDVELVEMDKRLKKTRVEAKDFMKDLNQQLEAAKRSVSDKKKGAGLAKATGDSKEPKKGSPQSAGIGADEMNMGVQVQAPNTNKNKSLQAKPAPLELTPKCATWQEDLDDWWQAHPDWDVASENATHFCFAPITDPIRAEMLRTVHQRQFPEDQKLCAGKENANIRNVAQHGFAGIVYRRLQKSFWQAHKENKLFLPGFPYYNFDWMYTPQNATQCPSKTQDHECYFLPVTNCPRPVGAKEAPWKKLYDWELFGSGKKFPVNKTLQEQALWLGNYLARPRHHVRHALYKFMHEEGNGVPKQLPTKCTWIHVRRGDAMAEVGYDRNFYSIQNYLTIGKINKEEPIVLLTDDQSAIEEATLLHPEYNWVYFERKRNRGPVAYNSHIPQDSDPFHEVMVLLAEQKVAAQCQKGVFGKSNMSKLLEAGMIRHHHLEDVELVEMDKKLKKTRVDAQDFMKDLNDKLEVAKNKVKKQQ